jgi:predicted nucleic acid-binding protein
MLLLDSDVVIDILRQHPGATAWLASVKGQRLAVPGFVALEVIDGCRDGAELATVSRTLAAWTILWLPEADCAAALRQFTSVHLANAIGPFDILIGFTALRNGVPLFTFNTKHYAVVPGLTTVQPYTR